MKENLNINQCVDGKDGELHQSVKLAPEGLVGSNPTPHTIKKGENMSLLSEWSDSKKLCNECETHKSTINYNDKNYCNWYCAKKGEK